MRLNILNECQFKYEKCIMEIDTFLINEYKHWLGKCQESIFRRLKRSLIKKYFYDDILFEVNIDRYVWLKLY